MKKYLVVCFTIIMISIVTGCGSNKTLKCSKEDNSSIMNKKETYTITFKKDTITKVEYIEDIAVAENYSVYIQQLEESLKGVFTGFEGMNGFEVTSTTDKNNIKIAVNIDLSKMDEASKKSLDIVDTKQNFNDAKQTFEKQNYQCK